MAAFTDDEKLAVTLSDLRALLKQTDLWDYVWEPQTSPLDRTIADLLEIFARSPATVSAALSRSPEDDAGYALIAYAQRAATFAVRERSARYVRSGLLALSLLGWLPSTDHRDVGYFASLLTDAARRVGAPDALFEEAARLATPEVAPAIRSAVPSHGLRGVVAQVLFQLLPSKAMRPTMTAEGFRYGQPVRTRAQAEAAMARVHTLLSGRDRPTDAER
jgi:hypothetical protein